MNSRRVAQGATPCFTPAVAAKSTTVHVSKFLKLRMKGYASATGNLFTRDRVFRNSRLAGRRLTLWIEIIPETFSENATKTKQEEEGLISMQTDELIRTLTVNCPPVRSLPHPCWRTIVWSTISLGYIAILVGTFGMYSGIETRLSDLRFLAEIGAALLTAMMAAAGALCAGCPGRPIWERFATAPFLLLWLSILGEGCWRDWLYGADGLTITPDLMSPLIIIAIGAGPGILIIIMIRHGAPIAPATTLGLATLATAASGAAALRLFRNEDASVMVLTWQFGSVVLLTGVGALLGRFFLRWPTRREALASLRDTPR